MMDEYAHKAVQISLELLLGSFGERGKQELDGGLEDVDHEEGGRGGDENDVEKQPVVDTVHHELGSQHTGLAVIAKAVVLIDAKLTETVH